MDKIINKLPAHIWLGIAVLLFGLGLTILTRPPGTVEYYRDPSVINPQPSPSPSPIDV